VTSPHLPSINTAGSHSAYCTCLTGIRSTAAATTAGDWSTAATTAAANLIGGAWIITAPELCLLPNIC